MEADDALHRLFPTAEAALAAVCNPPARCPARRGIRPGRAFADDVAVIDEYNQIHLAHLRAEAAREHAAEGHDGLGAFDGDVRHAAARELEAARARVVRLEMLLGLHLRAIRDADPGSGAPAELARRVGVRETAVRDALAADAQWRMPATGI
ncbi:hypothetical protein [Planomonospora sp. ID82291]|uniref:hypothetical protein n=1 Tax=Planomonospora sp. ID82291 TaxID=2738136 RepID=UPI0018C3926E|nr:hypothetical protein [Planomonospora sp. ID82291]MBG0818384.1 hypothetical protein [Planomonospora sp. ID82291]